MQRKFLRQEVHRRYGSNAKFAQAIGISERTIMRILHDDWKRATYANIEAVANGLGLSCIEFLRIVDTAQTEDEFETLYLQYKQHPEYHNAIRKLLQNE